MHQPLPGHKEPLQVRISRSLQSLQKQIVGGNLQIVVQLWALERLYFNPRSCQSLLHSKIFSRIQAHLQGKVKAWSQCSWILILILQSLPFQGRSWGSLLRLWPRLLLRRMQPRLLRWKTYCQQGKVWLFQINIYELDIWMIYGWYMDDMRMMKASMLVLMRNPPLPGKGLACSNEINDMRTIPWGGGF